MLIYNMHKNHHHAHCQHSALAHAEAYCQQHKLRFTDVRRRVFEIIWSGHKALTAAEIMETLDNPMPPITYRALDFLTRNGLIHHLTSLNAYVGCAHLDDDHGHHVGQLLVCTSCRNVTELEAQGALSKLQAETAKNGFQIQQTHIEMLGQCRNCQAAGLSGH